MGLYLGNQRITNLGETLTPREIQSVNGKTSIDGNITVLGSDTRVSESDSRKIDAALSDVADQIPTNVSQLSNDAGYLKCDGTVPMTGALNMANNHINNANYINANWYKINSTITSGTPASEILVKQNSWIYSRTPAQIRSDIGAQITGNYLTSIPTASSSTVGGVKINGNNLAILADGTLSAGGAGGGGGGSSDVYSKSYITDTTLGLNDQMSDLKVLKVTQNEYAEYLLNYTRAQLSNYVFILSSDVEDVFGKRIINAGEPTLSSDVATKNYVDSHVPEIDVKALTNLQVIRPDSTDNLYLSVQVFSDQSMTNRLTSIDSYQAANRAYFCGFNTNGSSYSWTNQPAEGFNEFYSNMPILIRLKNMNLPDIQEYFVLYTWYSINGSTYSYSDYYSTVIPSTTETGANAGMISYLLAQISVLQQQIDALQS